MKSLVPSLEVIDHLEKSPLGVELEIALGKLRTFKNITTATLRGVGMEKIIKSRTGLTVQLHVWDEPGMAVLVPQINKSNPIINRMVKMLSDNKDGTEFLKANDLIDGTVNLQMGTVSGDFAKVSSDMHINSNMVWSGSSYTVREATATLLHEIGHLIVYMFMLGRTTHTNYIITEASARLSNSSTKEQRIKILHAVEDSYGEDIPGIDTVAEKRRHNDAYRVTFLQLAAKESESQIGTNIYNSRMFEALADTFAARHGYAKDLAVAIDKLYRSFGDKVYTNSTVHAVNSVIKVLIFTGSIMSGQPYLIGYAAGAFLGSILLNSPLDVIYDPLPKRLDKIVSQLNDGLKDRSISKERKVRILDDIKTIEALISDTKDNQDVIEFVMRYILPHGRKQEGMVVVQERLEKMLNNKLFAAAAALEVR